MVLNSMTTMRLSNQDRKDLEKFTKFLALKSVQVIVQSRLGEKQKTRSKPHSSGSDWFNLDIADLPEIQAEAKRAMAGQVPSVGLCLCTEISLQTVDGDTLVLETWQLSVTEVCDPTVKVIYTVYNRMSLLLKSLIAVTRVTPAYKLSLRQGPDSYIICYRVYMGDPQVHLLGEGYQSVFVGQVGTPLGTINLSVLYRTKLTISPQRSTRENPIMVKSDYFKPDLSPKWYRTHHLDLNDLEDGITCLDGKEPPRVGHVPRSAERNIENHLNGVKEPEDCFVEVKHGAFAPVSETPQVPDFEVPESPFLTLLPSEPHQQQDCNANPTTEEVINNANEPSPVHHIKDENPLEDFVLVELKPPFADSEGNSDLGVFFRECQAAPMLSSFALQPTLEEQVTEIGEHLAALESSLPDIDQFVESVCQSETVK